MRSLNYALPRVPEDEALEGGPSLWQYLSPERSHIADLFSHGEVAPDHASGASALISATWLERCITGAETYKPSVRFAHDGGQNLSRVHAFSLSFLFEEPSVLNPL
jgi:hypothetical protein